MSTKIWHSLFSNSHSLIKVCAWCPKSNYPQLREGEQYTHGMCRKHYRQLSIKKNLALSLLIAELIENTRSRLDKNSWKSVQKFQITVKLYIQKLNSSTHHFTK